MSARRIVALFAVACALAACGNSAPKRSRQPQSSVPPAVASVGPGGVQQVRVSMTDALRFVPNVVVVRPGRVTVTLVDTGGVPHTFDVLSLNVQSDTIGEHETRQLSFSVQQPGRYRITCAYHVREGMVGTLEVTR